MKIESYDYKRDYKLDSNKRYVGTELELAHKQLIGIDYEDEDDDDENHVSSNLQKRADKISEYFKDWAFFKQDGSLQNSGFEIVSIPLTLEEQRKYWSEELFDKLNKKGFVSYDSTVSCGLHFHVSRAGLTYLQIGKVLKFLHNKDNRIFIKKIAQRHSDDYAEFRSKKTFGYVNKEFYKNKYDALNLGHKDTIEFRLFKGTLNHAAFHKNLEFCDSLINFCAPCRFSVGESLNWWNFVNYVESNKKNYFYLWDYIIQKEMDSVEVWNKHREAVKAKKEAKMAAEQKVANIVPDSVYDIVEDENGF